jgi:hypothetical protein
MIRHKDKNRVKKKTSGQPACGGFGGKEGEGEGGGYEQPRRPESREPNGPSALRAYSPARTAAADTAPSASCAFFEAAFSVDDDDDDDEDEEVEAKRRGALVRSRVRNVVLCMTFFVSYFLFCFGLGGGEGVFSNVRRVGFCWWSVLYWVAAGGRDDDGDGAQRWICLLLLTPARIFGRGRGPAAVAAGRISAVRGTRVIGRILYVHSHSCHFCSLSFDCHSLQDYFIYQKEGDPFVVIDESGSKGPRTGRARDGTIWQGQGAGVSRRARSEEQGARCGRVQCDRAGRGRDRD